MSNDTGPSPAIDAALARVRERIAAAAVRAGRDPARITLIAVSKTKPAQAVAAAMQAGQTAFGENRIQEAAAKFAGFANAAPRPRLHIIGALQTNKAADAVRISDVIESLDRPRLADAIAAAMAQTGRAPKLLIEVNVGAEPGKAGVSCADAPAFIDACRERFGSALVGLMCVPPAAEDPRPHFTWLAECAARHDLAEVSMGMSGDFEQAIACGSTCVRIGSAIFGGR